MKANVTKSSYIKVVYGSERLEDETLSKFEKQLIHQEKPVVV
jgi:hypothetical protein